MIGPYKSATLHVSETRDARIVTRGAIQECDKLAWPPPPSQMLLLNSILRIASRCVAFPAPCPGSDSAQAMIVDSSVLPACLPVTCVIRCAHFTQLCDYR